MFRNYVTKISYTGKNVDRLIDSGFEGEFITFNQTFKIGGVVPKDAKTCATLIRPVKKTVWKNGKKKIEETIKRFAVFHISQVQLPERKVS